MRILVVNDYDGAYGLFWGALGEISTRIPEFVADPEKFGLVCFTGGEDVSPELYGHENLTSHNSLARDRKEALIFEIARKYEIPMTGICRGSQFLNVMCGGTMVQDLGRDHPGGRHLCLTYTNQLFEVTSSHHQMSVPGPGGSCLAWAEIDVDPHDLTYDGSFADLADLYTEEGRIRVVEAIHYPAVKVFAVQHHPEWQDIDCEAARWTLDQIRYLILEKTCAFGGST
jgi:anthranilate/para-aminobenzoate synthase component II